jgi:two-component system, sensor histidine kinase
MDRNREIDAPALGAPYESATPARHVLLVEDDPAVRKATCMLLQTEGYVVSAASSICEAVEKATSSATLDIVVTDYHLHGSETGMHVIAALRAALDPELKAVLLTGASGPITDKFLSDARFRVINKPVSAKELFGVLRSLLAN